MCGCSGVHPSHIQLIYIHAPLCIAMYHLLSTIIWTCVLPLSLMDGCCLHTHILTHNLYYIVLISLTTNRGVKERCLDTSTQGLNSYYLSLYVFVAVICVLCVGALVITSHTYILYTYTHTYVHSYVSSIIHHMDVCPTTLSYGWLLFTHIMNHNLYYTVYISYHQ